MNHKADLVKNSAELFSVLPIRDNLNIFMFAEGNNTEGLEAKSSTIQKLGTTKVSPYSKVEQRWGYHGL
jgi:hypothetical protein